MTYQLGYMALAEPEFKRPGSDISDPAGEFQRAMLGLAAVRKRIGEDAFRYLSARLDENWRRLQDGEFGKLALSFGEMAYFLTSRQFEKTPSEFDALGEHTSVRGAQP